MFRTTLTLILSILAIGSSARAAEYASLPTGPLLETAPEPLGTASEPLLGTTPRLASPPGPVFSLGMPSPQRPPINTRHGHFGHGGVPVQQATPGTGWSGFGGVPTYQWGYFGAHYRPVKVYHRGYYGHRMSFGYRRGY